VHATHGAIIIPPHRLCAIPRLANCPGPKMGGPKKGPKLSRLGELLNTQKNVHFFAPRGAPPGGPRPGGQKVHPWRPPWGPPLGPPSNYKYRLLVPERARFGAHFGADFRADFRAPGGRPGRPGRPGGAPRGGRNFPEIFPREFPGPPGGPPGRGPRSGVQEHHAMRPIITDPTGDALHFVIAQCIGHSPQA